MRRGVFAAVAAVATLLTIVVLVIAAGEEDEARVEADRVMLEIIEDRGQQASNVDCEPLRVDDTWECEFELPGGSECDARLQLDDDPTAGRFCREFRRAAP